MIYRKLLIGLIVGVCAFLVWDAFRPLPQKRIPAITQQAAIDQKKITVEVVLDTGESSASAQRVPAATAFDALKNISAQRQEALKTKQYDFGIFVESVGIFSNTKDNVWVYEVNGTSGQVAADKYMLKDGDTVTWKYTKPSY